MKITVIIPVYNAAPYVRKAVESALAQPETGEVILIDDGGPDESLRVCGELESEFDKVRLFTHPGNANLGAGLSRNVGIDNARFDFIAFLDADDYYLPGRFVVDREIFETHPDADGVYNAAGRHYYSEEERERYTKLGNLELVTTKWPIPPDELFDTMLALRPSHGFIPTNCITLKSRAFEKAGRFSDLVLYEDTELLIKLAYFCNLYAGQLDQPVAQVGVHDRNRISRVERGSRTKELLFDRLHDWARANNLPKRYQKAFVNHRRAARIRRSNRIAAPFLLLSAGLRSTMFLRYPTFFYASLDHVLGGRVSRLRQRFRSS